MAFAGGRLREDHMALTDEISGQAPGQGLHEIRAPLATARHAPGYVYASDEMLQLEKEKLFMKDWLLMGREDMETVPTGASRRIRARCLPV